MSSFVGRPVFFSPESAQTAPVLIMTANFAVVRMDEQGSVCVYLCTYFEVSFCIRDLHPKNLWLPPRTMGPMDTTGSLYVKLETKGPSSDFVGMSLHLISHGIMHGISIAFMNMIQ